jgi:signal transduction histidine kinase
MAHLVPWTALGPRRRRAKTHRAERLSSTGLRSLNPRNTRPAQASCRVGEESAVSLRRTLNVTLAVMAAMTVAAALSLILAGAYFHRAAAALGAAVESVQIAEELQVQLLRHSRLRESTPPTMADAGRRARLESDLRERMALMHRFSSSAAETELIRAMQAGVERYLVESRATAGRTPVGRLPAADLAMSSAFDAVDRVVEVNVEQARDVEKQAERWDRIVGIGGPVIAMMLLGGTAAILLWVRRAALRPILHIADALRRFAAGDRAARAKEAGPAELVAMARTFNEMAAIVERQREAQLAFLAGVGHDLRGPISAFKLSLAVLSPDRPLPPEPEVRSIVQRLGRQTDKLERMVADLLDAARVEAGQLSLELEPCDVRELVSEVVEQYRPTSTAHRLQVSLPPTPVRVRCDPVRIEQVLGNLVGNAIKYSPEGGAVEVAVSTANGAAVVSVADQGVGIAPDDRPHIFEPFRRGASHDRFPGLGLGLAVTRRIVEAHGGRIDVESAPGAGSVFRVEFTAG